MRVYLRKLFLMHKVWYIALILTFFSQKKHYLCIIRIRFVIQELYYSLWKKLFVEHSFRSIIKMD